MGAVHVGRCSRAGHAPGLLSLPAASARRVFTRLPSFTLGLRLASPAPRPPPSAVGCLTDAFPNRRQLGPSGRWLRIEMASESFLGKENSPLTQGVFLAAGGALLPEGSLREEAVGRPRLAGPWALPWG